MTLNHLPRTFEEWRERAFEQAAEEGPFGQNPLSLDAAFAAGVASQQAEIERLKKSWDDLDDKTFTQLAAKDAEIERLKFDAHEARELHRLAGETIERHVREFEAILARYEAVVEATREFLSPAENGRVYSDREWRLTPKPDRLRAALAALEEKP